jgi:DNA-binding beta-propeller fold protein YncE
LVSCRFGPVLFDYLAEFDEPHSLAVASNAEVYVADTGNNRVRKIDAKIGFISTVTGEEGYGGPAAKAQFGGV